MLAGRTKETTTLCWQMPDAAWVHWAQGRGEKTIRDVILEGLGQIRKSPEAAKARCEAIGKEAPRDREVEQIPQHEIRIELPAGEWAAASRRVGPVSTGQLLGALILESDSWQQVGDADSEFGAGWHQVDLDSSLHSLTATTTGLSLGRETTILARIIAGAAIVGAAAAVASAVAAWCGLLAGS